MGIFQKKNTAPDDNDNDNFSKDADQTRFLRMAFTLAFITITGLFALEFWHPADQAMLFTPEIVHILVNGMAIGFFGLGAYIYGKNVGANEALAKMAGGRNGNGNGNQQKQTPQETK